MPVADPARPGRFAAFDGYRDRVYDTLKVQLRLAQACPGEDLGQLEVMLRDLDPTPSGDEPGDSPPPPLNAFHEAAVRLEPIIARGFDLKPYDEATGDGLTTLECLDLLNSFMASVARSVATAVDEAVEPAAESQHEAEPGRPSDGG